VVAVSAQNPLPLPADWLHARVCELRRRTRRRVFDPVLDLVTATRTGVRPLVTRWLPTAEPLDHALRVDLLLALRDTVAAERVPLHLVVTRAGPGTLESTDLAWRAAWCTACGVDEAAAGTTAVVTRYGFVDVTADLVVRTEPRRHRR
jgi:hypothetical protein